MAVHMGNIIDSNNPLNRPSVRAGQSLERVEVTQKTAEPRAAAPKPDGGHVQFSDSVALLERMQDQINAEPSISQDRINAARQAIADGSYKIDHAQIASSLLALDVDLP